MWKKIMTVNFLLLFSVIASSPFFVSRSREFPELWEAPVQVMDPDWDESWYRRGKGGTTHTACIGVSNKIYSIVRTNSSKFFTDIYVNHYPNKYLNIVYLSLTDVSPETTSRVHDLLRPPRGTSISFIEAPAPLSKVKEWRRELRELWPFLWSRGVRLNSMSLSPNGTILLGLEEVTQERVETLSHLIEGIVPTGILVVYESEGLIELNEAVLVSLEGMLSQEDDPDHDWERDPVGPKVLTLEVLDPEDNLDYESYYLKSRGGEFYRFFPPSRRINDIVWSYLGPEPVNITGAVERHVGANQEAVRTIRVFEIGFSGLGQWYEGVLGTKEVELGSYQFHDRLYNGLRRTVLSLTLESPLPDSQDNEVILASHEGYVYDVPYCGTGQPIADYSSGQSVMIRGLLTEIVDSEQRVFQVLMIFEVKPGYTSARERIEAFVERLNLTDVGYEVVRETERTTEALIYFIDDGGKIEFMTIGISREPGSWGIEWWSRHGASSPSLRVEIVDYSIKHQRRDGVRVLEIINPLVRNLGNGTAYVAKVVTTVSNSTHTFSRTYRTASKGSQDGLIRPGESVWFGEVMPGPGAMQDASGKWHRLPYASLVGETFTITITVYDGADTALAERSFVHKFQ